MAWIVTSFIYPLFTFDREIPSLHSIYPPSCEDIIVKLFKLLACKVKLELFPIMEYPFKSKITPLDPMVIAVPEGQFIFDVNVVLLTIVSPQFGLA